MNHTLAMLIAAVVAGAVMFLPKLRTLLLIAGVVLAVVVVVGPTVVQHLAAWGGVR